MPRRKAENKTIDVILLINDKHLGEKYEIVKVRPVYARNILLPQKLAVLADSVNQNAYAQKMKSAEADRQKKAQSLDEVFAKIQEAGGITLVRKANKDHTLYAKVDEHDIITAIKELHGVEVEAHFFKMKKKLTTIGQFSIPFLYKTLKKELVVNIEADPEEEKKHKKSEEKTEETVEGEEKVKKTREEIQAEKEEARKIKKAETLKRLKEKYV
ncbi:MAG: 50S ribosomal protein L9 [bacterium]